MDEIEQKARRHLHKWKIGLGSRDRTTNAIVGNFDELIGVWHKLGVSVGLADELMKEAVKAHCPADSLIKYKYKEYQKQKFMTEEEFKKNWCSSVETKAYQSFYSYYDMEEDIPDTPVPKMYGSMSEQEYKLQRKYADSFPDLDLNSINHEDLFVNIEEL